MGRGDRPVGHLRRRLHGKTFQRTAPAEFVGLQHLVRPVPKLGELRRNGAKGWSYYEPGEIETLWVLDVNGTVIIINTRAGSDHPAAAHAELAAVLDSIRIDPPRPPLLGAAVEHHAWDVLRRRGRRIPTPRIFITLGDGWSTEGKSGISNDAGHITFSQPDLVFLDACHTADGFHPGPLTTLNGLVTALSEQARMDRSDRPHGHLCQRL